MNKEENIRNYSILFNEEISRLDTIIGGKYLGDSSPVPKNQLHIAYMWLENDISFALYKADDMVDTRDEIENILKGSWAYEKIIKTISFEKALRRAEIRRDFATALKSVKNGTDLSGVLGYSFSEEDLKNLAKLHKENRFREKIENLLTDCNFHVECSWLSSQEYAKFGIV